MQQELHVLESNKTWVLTTFPKEKKVIRCKWVYKVKYKPTSKIDKLKAHLVAEGYNQIEGLDYKDIFSPVAKLTTMRIFIALATIKQWHVFQLDINNAFLHSFLDEEVYMYPQGYQKVVLRRFVYSRVLYMA